MSDSDGDYMVDDSPVNRIGSRNTSRYGTRASGPAPDLAATSVAKLDTNDGKTSSRRKAAWEDIQRSWETVVEGADGSIDSVVEGLREAGMRKRFLRDTTPLQRGIIRHLILILDLSFAMVEKDLRPTRYLLTIRYASDFVTTYFEQNPISQLGILGMRDGLALRISDVSGNPMEHLEKLKSLREKEPQGNPSLQNALEMSRGLLYHAPSHGTREVLIIYGALLSSDPGDIHDTISSLITDRIQVSIVGLAATLAICAEICSRTNAGSVDNYHVALNEQHFREIIMARTTPPVTRTKKHTQSSLLMMGFPSRMTTGAGQTLSFCACHHKLTRNGYHCSRCETKVCSLPAQCPACGLTLILSTHLARSCHHLFPLRNWVEVPWSQAQKSQACFACLSPFPQAPSDLQRTDNSSTEAIYRKDTRGFSESGRYACEGCHNVFCIDCDVFSHEVTHNCPGCRV
ncbi:General transcription and DNA repair factor IIH subunit ssl1 [Golovinomyces cichoracearum]|uniref:General transcription and DNA repair factor IIH n=1 Tax=Golovinomyces cichoracearum TaxID=62708 RepID=A0A420I7Z7_9PEZI|nr:General transcription and DNA repair factor IIH subunit ssl1 [Golovinomyces cichoracearum]